MGIHEGCIQVKLFMASADQVKRYLAHWLQLGRKIYIHNGDRSLSPHPVIEGNRYSKAFEECWQTLLAEQSGDCYLEDTDQTIAELLTDKWDIILCCRCVMPIPMTIGSMESKTCPCISLSSWPNLDLPLPRSPVDNQSILSTIKQRLIQTSEKPIPAEIAILEPGETPPPVSTTDTELLNKLPKCQCSHQVA